MVVSYGAEDTRWLLDRVLDGLDYPAYKWQILAQADIYGVDTVTRERLCRLPARRYASPREVASTVDSVDRMRGVSGGRRYGRRADWSVR